MSKDEQGIVVLTVAYHSDKSLIDLASNLYRQTRQPYKWLVVNNSPLSSGELKLISKCPVSIIAGGEGDGFSKGCNHGLTLLEKSGWRGWVWFLNPDTSFFDLQTIERLEAKLTSLPSNALLGTAVLAPAGDLESSAGWLDDGLNFRRRHIDQSLLESTKKDLIAVDWLSGCSLLMRPSAHRKQPRFEPALPLYYEDMDLCIRLSKEGVPIFWLPKIKIAHQRGYGSEVSSSRRLRLSTCSYIRFLQRHKSGFVLIFRSLRLILNSLMSVVLSPGKSFAKLCGLFDALCEPLK